MKAKDMTFEDAMKELKQTLELLDTGTPSLDESIKYFKRGLELAKSCQKRLDEAEMAVKKIEDSGGLPKEVPAPELEEEP